MADLEREFYLRIFVEQTKTIKEQNEAITKLTAEVQALRQKIEELSKQKAVRKDSHNSSQPPSSDGYMKPAPKSLRKSSGKPQGGQSGHKGSGMKITREPDETLHHYPTGCENCPRKCNCNFSCADTHYTYDIEVKTKLIAHKVYTANCPLSGNNAMKGTFPNEARAKKQYGINLRAFVVTLLAHGYVSVARTKELIECLGIPISTGTIQNMMENCADKTESAVEIIKEKVAALRVVHCDETGVDVNGTLHWIHCLCNPNWSYCVLHEKRGAEAIEEIGILPSMKNSTVVHDFWRPYLNYTNVKHGFCNAHLERELVYAYETSKQLWAQQMLELLSEMCGKRNELLTVGVEQFKKQDWSTYFERYDRYIAAGIEMNPIPVKVPGKKGRTAKGKIRCLLERLQDYKDDILRFTKDWEVPFTNNEAERTIRFTKVKEKISGCFRKKTCAEDFVKIMSYIGTARKHGTNAYDALRSVFRGDANAIVKSWL